MATGAMNQIKTLNGASELRKNHQDLAKLAAASGVIPVAFANDPTFLDLVSAYNDEAKVDCLDQRE